jgi:hypothetical protein
VRGVGVMIDWGRAGRKSDSANVRGRGRILVGN